MKRGDRTSLTKKRFESECNELIERLRENSNELVDSIGDKVRDSFYDAMQKDRKEVFNQLFLNIYRHDTKALRLVM